MSGEDSGCVRFGVADSDGAVEEISGGFEESG